MAAFEQRLDSFFHITERGSTLRTELKAGFITFLTMFYILAANPHIISTAIGPEFFGQLVDMIPPPMNHRITNKRESFERGRRCSCTSSSAGVRCHCFLFLSSENSSVLESSRLVTSIVSLVLT